MFVNYQQNQQFLLPPSLDELLPKNHLARLVSEIVENLDIENVKDKYNDLGRPAYHPKMMIKILFYGYAVGIRSSRRLAKALETDIAFMWLSAMNRPDFRTVSDFRKNNLSAVEGLFTQIVATCISSGMATIGKVAIDGTKIKANASKRSIRDEARLKDMLGEIDKKIKEMLGEAEDIDEAEDKLYGDMRGDELPKELSDEKTRKKKIKEALERIDKERNKDGSKKKLSITDTDASLMKTTSGIMPSYNAQAVASQEGLILAADVSSDSFDNHLLGPMIENLKENTSKKPGKVLADAGYYSGETLKYIEKEEIDAFIPILENIDKNRARGRSKNTAHEHFQKQEFMYDKEKDCYVCPVGKELCLYKKDKRKNKTIHRYICKIKDCKSRHLCTNSKTGRTIDRLGYEELYEKMIDKMKTEEASDIYRKRQGMVEPVFSIIKGPLGFDKFYLRGKQKVQSEWFLICSAFNIFKMWKIEQRTVNTATI